MRPVAVALLLLPFAASCRSAAPVSAPASVPPSVQPGAPGQPTRAMRRGSLAVPAFTEADVRFMQGMIGHHAQALEMTALIADRTSKADMRLLGLRIEVSQTDEIKTMQRWLGARGQMAPGVHDMHMHGGALMPGMLSPEQMARLAAAKGPEFERLFLEFMIQHHEGALVMVKDLFASAGAAQDSDIFAFASDVEADQLIEIRRMRAMLAAGR
jgi:uncharacterized protein (DUF305 family)